LPGDVVEKASIISGTARLCKLPQITIEMGTKAVFVVAAA